MRPFEFGRSFLFIGACIGIVGCSPAQFDLDLRDNAYSTTEAARRTLDRRPTPDQQGIITYPNYQVAVARSGDTLQKLADRIGVDALSLARYNGIKTTDRLRSGEIIALPGRIAGTTQAETTPSAPQERVDVTQLAEEAISNSPDKKQQETPKPKPVIPEALEPIRHKVKRGETAFTVSRLYNVSIRALAEWNALDGDFTIREGQYLLIPLASVPAAKEETSSLKPLARPGGASVTPKPPSSSTPLPSNDDTLDEAVNIVAQKETQPIATPSGGTFVYPVNGRIIREYVANKTDGIDLSAPVGTSVVAAGSGTVAAVTSDANKVPIVVIKHPNNLLTVYANIGDISVEKGNTVRKGQPIGKMRSGNPAYVHFEVRDGLKSVDPMTYLK